MKNTFKALGIIALVAVISLAFASCGDAGDSGNSGGNVTSEKAVYTSVDDEGNKYELTITPQSDRAAYEPKAGDTYTLKIFYVDGTTKISVGTVTQEVKSGSTVTATLSVSDISYTVTLITITDEVRVFTEIKGTIPITSDNDDDPPTIEIELTLTPQVEKESDVVIGVILNKTALALDVGGSETLVATVLPSNAANKNVTWSSSDDAVAQVSQSGLVSAVVAGNATITVTTEEGEKTAICNVSVKEDLIEDQTPVVEDYTISGLGTVSADGTPKSVTIQPKAGKSPGAVTVLYNESTTAPSAIGTYAITFNVVAANGWNPATGLTAGTLIIISDDITNQTPVAEDYNITGTGTVSADGTPKTVTIQPKAGKSSGAVTVLYNGNTTAPSAAGTYAITFNVAAANGWNSATGLVGGTLIISTTTVSVPVTGVSLNKTSLDLYLDESETLISTVLPANATNKSVDWISNDPTIATVTNGLVTAKKSGSAEITVTTQDGGFTAKCVVTARSEDEQPFTSIASFERWLSKQPDNTPTSAYEVKLNVSDLTGIQSVLTDARYKYVKLDFSGSTIISIGNNTFTGCRSLTSIIIPNGVTSIGDHAFFSCENLVSVNVPNSIINIGWSAFASCFSLSNLTLPNGVISIGSSAFSNCGFASFAIPDSVTSLDRDAFSFCTSLTNVTIGSGITNIDFQTFSGCEKLTNITIPNSVNSIGSGAFIGCSSLASVTFQGVIPSSEFVGDAFMGDLRAKFYATDTDKGTPGTYTTTAPTSISSIWTLQQ